MLMAASIGAKSRKPNGKRRSFQGAFAIEGIEVDREGNFTVDWQKLGLLRELKSDELLCLKIYELYRREHGDFPRSELKYTLLRRESVRHGREAALKPDEVEDFCFAHLFPHNEDIPFSAAVRRFLADSTWRHEAQECEVALVWYTNHLTSKSPDGARVIPTAAEVDRAAQAGLVVPGLVSPVPTADTMMRRFGISKWTDLVVQKLSATSQELSRKHVWRLDLDELVEDYERAFEHFYPHFTEGDQCFVTYKQLSEFGKNEKGLGSNRYKTVLKRESDKQNRNVTLNDVRRLAGLPEDPRIEERTPRTRLGKNWDKSSIYQAYIVAWNFIGADQEPPSPRALMGMVTKQTDLINEGLFKVVATEGMTRSPYAKRSVANAPSKEIVLNADAAELAGVPSTLMPSNQVIINYFGNMASFLYFVEKTSGRDVTVTDSVRNAHMAVPVVQKLKKDNGGELPSAEVIESTLEKIPPCVAQVIRTKFGLPNPQSVEHEVPHLELAGQR